MSDQQEEALAAAMPQAQAAVEAGAAAIEAEPDPAKRKQAATAAIQKTGLSKEDAEMIADALVARAELFADAMADRFEQRGAFDQAPEPVTPPTSIAEPNATGMAVPTAAGQPVPEPPRKKTWAERFRGA